MDTRKRQLAKLHTPLGILGLLLVATAWFAFFYYWDTSRIIVKRLMAEDRYEYDVLKPEHLSHDPRAYIKIHNPKDASNKRAKLIESVWGSPQVDLDLMPTEVRKDLLSNRPDTDDCPKLERGKNETRLRLHCQLYRYQDWPSLASLDELIVQVGPLYKASIALFVPTNPNGALVIYQNGYASTYHHHHGHLKRLIEAGYMVAAANHISYGDNQCRSSKKLRAWCGVGAGRFEVPYPMRVHFSPLLAAINYTKHEFGVSRVAAMGLSAGGWLVSVMSAIDSRIGRSYPVAGFMPPFLQVEGESPPNQQYKPLFEAASMLEQFVLAADGKNRRQVQIFNQYDRCCYANRRATLYEQAVQDAVESINGGDFSVVIDDTHPRHKISSWAMSFILDDLKKGEWK